MTLLPTASVAPALCAKVNRDANDCSIDAGQPYSVAFDLNRWLSRTDPLMGLLFRGRKMTAIAKVLSRVAGTQVEIETLKTIAMFCGVGLFVWLLSATYGLDLSPGFF
jgi:hypothetical protein